MRLIDVISERGIVLSHSFDEGKLFWNTIYDLLGTHASFSMGSEKFKNNLQKMDLIESEINPESLFCVMKTEEAFKPVVLFVRLRKPLTTEDGTPIKFVFLLIVNMIYKEHLNIEGEILQLFKSVSLEKIFNNARDSLHAFHLLKQFAMKNVYSMEIMGGFNVYGTEESKNKSD